MHISPNKSIQMTNGMVILQMTDTESGNTFSVYYHYMQL